MKALKTLIATLALAVPIISCTTFSSDKMIFGQDPMTGHVRDWTRSAKLYRQFDTTALIHVTYNSMALRQKTVEKMADSKVLKEGEKARALEEQARENEKYIQLYAAIYTPEPEWSELATKNPAWVVFLDTPSGPVYSETPDQIMEDELPWAANLPYDPRFFSFYKINIPRQSPASGRVNVVLSSLLGEARISWEGP